MKDGWIEKIYAGILGMDAGMRLGAPVENPWWTYLRLQEYFGDIRGYLREYKTHPADDDVNGPIIFFRTLTDNDGKEFTAQMGGETWLNYTRCGHGMFWWGGEDVSTEHRAYMNLRRGIPAPVSGSIAQNGIVAAEQIGGQIFVDTWGLVCPDNPKQAAVFARRMASVSHDGEALNGAAFMAACIAAAFSCETPEDVIDVGLHEIPADSIYHQVVDAVIRFHSLHPEDFRKCRDYIDQNWGNKKFPGGYHIIPNAGICILALLYGGNDFSRTIEISCMCGFDTDCNTSNVGTIMGVLHGIAGIPGRYRSPINDTAVLSSVSGYLNIVDFPSFTYEVAKAVCRLRDETMPKELLHHRLGELHFNFELTGSTHGLELSDHASHELRWIRGKAHTGQGCLELEIDGKEPAPVNIFFKASYIRDDFESERYEPVFSPRVYPGQTVSCWMRSCQTAPAEITVTPFVTRAMTGDRIELPAVILPGEEWKEIIFIVPDLDGDQIHNIGWKVEIVPQEPPWALGKVYLDDISVSGPMDYSIDFLKQRMEFGQPTPFSTNDCEAQLDQGMLCIETTEGSVGQAFTGNYYTHDVRIETQVTVDFGDISGLIVRGQGCRRYYALGFTGRDQIGIFRWEAGRRIALAREKFSWKNGKPYILRAEAKEDIVSLFIDNKLLLEAEDGCFSYGMLGIYQEGRGKSHWSNFQIFGNTLPEPYVL